MSTPDDFRALLKRWRDRADLSQEALASLLQTKCQVSIGASYISSLEVPQQNTMPPAINKVQGVKVTVDDFATALDLSDAERAQLVDAARRERFDRNEEFTQEHERRQADGNQGRPPEWGDKVTLWDFIGVPVIPRNFKGDSLEVAMNGEYVDAQGAVGPCVPVSRSVADEHGPLLAYMAEGDELLPRLDHDGHVVAAVQGKPVSGKAVLVNVDGEVRCRIWREDGETIVLESVNPLYGSRRLTRAEIDWVYPIVWSGRPGL